MFRANIFEVALFVLFWKYEKGLHPDYVYCSTREIKLISELLRDKYDVLLDNTRGEFDNLVSQSRYLKIEGESADESGDLNSIKKTMFAVKNMSKEAEKNLAWRIQGGIWKVPGVKEIVENFLVETTKNDPLKKESDVADVPKVLSDLFSGKIIPTKKGELKIVGNKIFLGKKSHPLEDAIVFGEISSFLLLAIGY